MGSVRKSGGQSWENHFRDKTAWLALLWGSLRTPGNATNRAPEVHVPVTLWGATNDMSFPAQINGPVYSVLRGDLFFFMRLASPGYRSTQIDSGMSRYVFSRR